MSECGINCGKRFIQWQGSVFEDLSYLAEPDFLADCLDGRLTSLDRLVGRVPSAEESVRQRAIESGLLPELVEQTLGAYPGRPAEWLTQSETAIDEDKLLFLAGALTEVLGDGHREAIIKCLGIWSAVKAGTFKTSVDMIELLKVYPNDKTTRSRADSAIRASWGARKVMLQHQDESYFEEAGLWARAFWLSNARTSYCVRRQPEQATNETTGTQSDHPQAEPSPEADAHLRQKAMNLLSSYAQALEMSGGDLHSPERTEIHAGLVTRVGREVITVLGLPDLWCMEHGAHVVRMLVEARISLQWMEQQDPSIFEEFQNYGAGKAKLYAKILDELPEEARTQDFSAGIEELVRLSHNSDVLDFRVVDTRDSFAGGKSLRAMADECGLIDFYRHAYYMASGVAHSEWWSIETHALVQCRNILHGGHRISNLSLNAGEDTDLATSWLDSFEALVWQSMKWLAIDMEIVRSAFDWSANDSTKP